MRHLSRIGFMLLFAVAISASAIAGPKFPPVPWGYERTFYDANGAVVGQIIADCSGITRSWGAVTADYEDSPTVCL